MPAPLHLPQCPPACILLCSVITAEYCERGSLADLLARARHDPAAAAALPWSRRLSMVGGLVLVLLDA